jgi:UDP-N-acetylglucosamine diphosphorylase / glucose-1-phosphate thymidylyltransferase / UDP-N-acetylgalactosamine diphosphorylase / glucosamine-1-phosphate N-acetyltransferase / galactosamine-1-phosphate N-acetyltransferase
VRLCVFEDAGVVNLEPLSLTRPAFDLWCGAGPLLPRLQRYFAAQETAVAVRAVVAPLCRQNHPGLGVNDPAWLRASPCVLVNARWLPSTAPSPALDRSVVGVVGDQVAYVVLPRGEAREGSLDQLNWLLEEWKQTLPRQDAGGWMLDYPWHLVERNATMLAQDASVWKAEKADLLSREGLTILGPAEQVVIDAGARVEPHVLIDATRGPVLVDRGAVVQAFSRLEGPCYIGAGTQIMAGRIRGGSIGPECRVGGEIETSVMQGYSNKYHEGFLGHSYVGAWVNFGAGAQVSDLRNDYGPITMTIAGRKVPSGLVKIGAYVGDHTRTSITTLLNTGTVVGPFSQLLTSGTLLPRVLPAFCSYGHGRVQERTDLSQMLSTAQTVLARRGRQWTEIDTELFFSVYEETAGVRRQVIRESEQQRMRRVV